MWDSEDAGGKDCLERLTEADLKDLGVVTWFRCLGFRVPGAKVVLVGNKCDKTEAPEKVAEGVERACRKWVTSWRKQTQGHRSSELCLEQGVSLVSCANQSRFPGIHRDHLKTGWPCDRNAPGLMSRIAEHSDGTPEMILPSSWARALEFLDQLAADSRQAH